MERDNFTFNGVRMSYLRRCGKYPVLFIHGFTASSEIWTPMVEKLNPELDLIFVDLFGHGQSEFPPIDGADVDISAIIGFQAAAIGALVNHLELHNFTVVGSSLGGWISMELSVNNIKPDGLVLIDTAGVTSLNDMHFKTGLEELAGEYSLERNEMTPLLKKIIGDPNPNVTLMDDKLVENADFDISVIWGVDDPILDVNVGEAFSKRLRKHSFHPIDDAGHTPFTVKPQEVATLINSFVSGRAQV